MVRDNGGEIEMYLQRRKGVYYHEKDRKDESISALKLT